MHRAIVKNLAGVQINCNIEMSSLADLQAFVQFSGEINKVWGKPQRNQWKDETSAEDLLLSIGEREVEVKAFIPGDPNAVPPIPDTPAIMRTQVTLKADYTVEYVDIQSEVDAANAKKAQIRNLVLRVKALGNQNDLTAAELKEAIMKLLRMMILLNQLD